MSWGILHGLQFPTALYAIRLPENAELSSILVSLYSNTVHRLQRFTSVHESARPTWMRPAVAPTAFCLKWRSVHTSLHLLISSFVAPSQPSSFVWILGRKCRMVLCVGYMGRLGAVGLRYVPATSYAGELFTGEWIRAAARPALSTSQARCLSTFGLQVCA